jgi:hypothetical protein
MLRAIGKGAHWIVAIIVTVIMWVFRVILAIITVILTIHLLRQLWSLIDPAHPGSLKSIGGIAGCFVFGLLILATIGEVLNPFDMIDAIRGAKLEGGSGYAPCGAGRSQGRRHIWRRLRCSGANSRMKAFISEVS